MVYRTVAKDFDVLLRSEFTIRRFILSITHILWSETEIVSTNSKERKKNPVILTPDDNTIIWQSENKSSFGHGARNNPLSDPWP